MSNLRSSIQRAGIYVGYLSALFCTDGKAYGAPHSTTTYYNNNDTKIGKEMQEAFKQLQKTFKGRYPLDAPVLTISCITSIAGTEDQDKLQWIAFLKENLAFIDVLVQNEVQLRDLSRMLSGAGSGASQAFKELFDQLFEKSVENNKENKEGGYTPTSKLLALQENKEVVTLTDLAAMVSGAGVGAPKAFGGLFTQLFKKRLDRLVIKISERSSSYPVKKSGHTLKSKLLALQKNKDIVTLPDLSRMLDGAGTKAPEAFEGLFKQLFKKNKNKENRYTPTSKLLALQKNKDLITLTDLSIMLSGAGADACKFFEQLFDKLFEKQRNGYAPGPALLALQKNKDLVTLTDLSVMLRGAGADACKFFEQLFDKLFKKQGNGYALGPALLALQKNKEVVTLTDFSRMLDGAGIEAPRAFEKLFRQLFEVENCETNYENLASGLQSLHLASPQATDATPTLRFKALQDNKEIVTLTDLSYVLNGAGPDAPSVFSGLFGVLFKDGHGRYHPSQALRDLENRLSSEEPSLQNFSVLLAKSGKNASAAFDTLCKLLMPDSVLRNNLVEAQKLKCNSNKLRKQLPDELLVREQAKIKLDRFLKDKDNNDFQDTLAYLDSADNKYKQSSEPNKKTFEYFYKQYYKQDGRYYRYDLIDFQRVSDKDGRTGLHGQDELVALEDISPGELLGIYTGIYLSEEEVGKVSKDLESELDWLQEQSAGGLNKIGDYAYEIVLNKTDKLCVSGFGRGNPLIKTNAHLRSKSKKDRDNDPKKAAPNVETVTMRYKNGIPFIAFWSTKEINKQDKILIDYGAEYWENHWEGNRNLSLPDASIYQNFLENNTTNDTNTTVSCVAFLRFLQKEHPDVYQGLMQGTELTSPKPFSLLNKKDKKTYNIGIDGKDLDNSGKKRTPARIIKEEESPRKRKKR